MTKVLFLDVDGALNGHEKHPGSVYCGIRPDCMAELNRVIAATGCKLVISSAWRYYVIGPGESRCMSIVGFQQMLATHGLVFAHGERLVIGCTDRDMGPWEGEAGLVQRGDQICRWHDRMASRLEISAWAVVDDLAVKLGEANQHRLVQTDGAKGLTADDADKLITLLGAR